jgi:hypothetical protein
MKSHFRARGVLFVIGTLPIIFLTTLFLNLAHPSIHAGDGDPTVAAYLPLVLQAADLDSTPTATPTATATPNPNEFDVVEFDPLSPEQPVLELLADQQAHLYPIIFENDGAITITAVAESTVNLVLEIIDSAHVVVQQANNGGSGDPEAIVNAQLDTALAYKIRVYDINGAVSNYCLIFSEGGGFPDLIKGRIEYGQPETDMLEVLGIDYWCFMGANGDNVSVSVSTTGSEGDLVIGLFGPPDFHSIGSAFQNADILNVNLEADGMYIIGVLDFQVGTPEYTLTLTKN